MSRKSLQVHFGRLEINFSQLLKQNTANFGNEWQLAPQIWATDVIAQSDDIRDRKYLLRMTSLRAMSSV